MNRAKKEALNSDMLQYNAGRLKQRKRAILLIAQLGDYASISGTCDNCLAFLTVTEERHWHACDPVKLLDGKVRYPRYVVCREPFGRLVQRRVTYRAGNGLFSHGYVKPDG